MHFNVKLYAILKFSNAIAKKSKLLFRDPLKIFKNICLKYQMVRVLPTAVSYS